MDITLNELQVNLAQFYGGETLHKWSRLFPNYYITEGVKYLADQAGAYWLLDAIASWQVYPRVRREEFQVWTLTVNGNEAELVADDGNGNALARQHIPFTDFPLPTIKLYFENQVICLPQER